MNDGGMDKRGIRMIVWNVAGIKNKDEEFWEYLNNFDIIGLSETWLEEKDWENWCERMPCGWRWRSQCARRENKRGRAMGGIITGVREELEEEEYVDTAEGIQERRIVVEGERWRIMTIYNRGDGEELIENIKKTVKEKEKEILLICGNFNARIGSKGGTPWTEQDKDRNKRCSKDRLINKQGRELLETVEDRGWMVLNGEKYGDEDGEWTYEKNGNKSVIDLGIANIEAWDRIEKFKVQCRTDSDHQPITIRIRGEKKKGE